MAQKYDPESFTKLYINGEHIEAQSGKSFSLKDPKNNEQVVSAVPIACPEDVDLAIDVAEEAYHGEWSKFTAIQRTECLHRLDALVDEELVSILRLDSPTSGNPTSIISTREKMFRQNCPAWCLCGH